MRPFSVAIGVSALASILSTLLVERLLTTSVTILDPLLSFHLSHNPGIAFGAQLGAMQTPLILIALVALTIVAIRTAKTTESQIGFGLILGGGLGNVIDRLGDGTVTDFISVLSFPTFNVADSCITFGVVLLLMESLVPKK